MGVAIFRPSNWKKYSLGSNPLKAERSLFTSFASDSAFLLVLCLCDLTSDELGERNNVNHSIFIKSCNFWSFRNC